MGRGFLIWAGASAPNHPARRSRRPDFRIYYVGQNKRLLGKLLIHKASSGLAAWPLAC